MPVCGRNARISELAWISVRQVEFLLQPGGVITLFHSHRGFLPSKGTTDVA